MNKQAFEAKDISTFINDFIEKHPQAAAALFGGAVGSGVGALYAKPGERTSDALAGGALGAGLGTLGSYGLDAARAGLQKITPSQRNVVIAGGLTGGLVGGLKGKALVPKWVKERNEERKAASLKENTMTKEEQTKEAQFKAFDFGMSAFLAEQGISKQAMAQELNVPAEKLSEAVIAWLMDQK